MRILTIIFLIMNVSHAFTQSYNKVDLLNKGNLYYEEKDLERIRIDCQKDTLTVAQLLLKYKGKDLIKEENIEFV